MRYLLDDIRVGSMILLSKYGAVRISYRWTRFTLCMAHLIVPSSITSITAAPDHWQASRILRCFLFFYSGASRARKNHDLPWYGAMMRGIDRDCLDYQPSSGEQCRVELRGTARHHDTPRLPSPGTSRPNSAPIDGPNTSYTCNRDSKSLRYCDTKSPRHGHA